MAGPFVISAKLVGDSTNMVGAVQAAETEVNQLNRAVNTSAAGMRAHGEATGLSRVQMQMFAHEGKATFDMIAAGASPLRVLTMEGIQLADAFSMNEGGVLGTFKALGPVLVPAAIAAAIFGIAIGEITHQINENQKAQVSWGDTTKAIFQTLADDGLGALKKATVAVPGWFWSAWGFAKGATYDFFNFIVRAVMGFETTTASIIGALPDIFTIAGQDAADGFLKGISWMVQQAEKGINKLIDAANAFGAGIKHLDPFNIKPADLGGKAAQADLDKRGTQLTNDLLGVATTDYAGNFLGQVQTHAVQNAQNDGKTKKGGKVSDYDRSIQSIHDETASLITQTNVIGLSTFAAEKLTKQTELENAARKDAIGLTPARVAAIDLESTAYARQKATLDDLTMVYSTGKSALEDLFSSTKSNIEQGQSLWQSLGNAAISALDGIANKALSMAADGVWDMIWGGASQGGTQGGGLGSIVSGLFGLATGSAGAVANSFDGGMSTFATGTNYAPGGLAKINEQGGEIVNLPSGAQVIPHDVSMAMAQGAGSAANNGNFNHTSNYYIDAKGGEIGVEEKIYAMLREYDNNLNERIDQFLQNPRRRGPM